jgi:hypothetical protein
MHLKIRWKERMMRTLISKFVVAVAVMLFCASNSFAAEDQGQPPTPVRDAPAAAAAQDESVTKAALPAKKKQKQEEAAVETSQAKQADQGAVPIPAKDPAKTPAAGTVHTGLPPVKLADHEQLVPPEPQKPAVNACPEEMKLARDYKNRMTFMPIPMLLGIGSFKYQGVLSDRATIDIMPVFYTLLYDTKYAGGGMELGFSIFPVTKAPGGFNFSFGAMPLYVRQNNTLVVVPKMTFGYNWIWDSGFTLGLSGGMMGVYQNSFDKVDSSEFRVLPYLDLNIGFVF